MIKNTVDLGVETPGKIAYEMFHRTMHGHESGAFKLLSPRQRLSWEKAAHTSSERQKMLIEAAEHLLLAATGRDDGPTSWTETRDRWLERAKQIVD